MKDPILQNDLQARDFVSLSPTSHSVVPQSASEVLQESAAIVIVMGVARSAAHCWALHDRPTPWSIEKYVGCNRWPSNRSWQASP